jgi:hypothetical protein
MEWRGGENKQTYLLYFLKIEEGRGRERRRRRRRRRRKRGAPEGH